MTIDNSALTSVPLLSRRFPSCKSEWYVTVSSNVTRTTSGILPPVLFFFSLRCSTIRRQTCTSGRPVFEYARYYGNGEHDNHERFPDVRTMSSPRFWTGANGNKTGPERHHRHRPYQLLSASDATTLTGVLYIICNKCLCISFLLLAHYRRVTIFYNLS